MKFTEEFSAGLDHRLHESRVKETIIALIFNADLFIDE